MRSRFLSRLEIRPRLLGINDGEVLGLREGSALCKREIVIVAFSLGVTSQKKKRLAAALRVRFDQFGGDVVAHLRLPLIAPTYRILYRISPQIR